jgi:hypothetical protein
VLIGVIRGVLRYDDLIKGAAELENGGGDVIKVKRDAFCGAAELRNVGRELIKVLDELEKVSKNELFRS